MCHHLGVSVIDFGHARELRPGIVARTRCGRLWEELEIDDGLCAMSHRSTDTIVTRIASANDDNVLAMGVDVFAVLQARVLQGFGVLLQEVHSEMDPVRFPTGNSKVSRPRGTGGDYQGIILFLELSGVNIGADVGIRDEVDPFLCKQVDSSLNDLLVKLHIGNAILQETSDTVISVVNGDQMSSLVKSLRASQTSGTRANYRDLLTGT